MEESLLADRGAELCFFLLAEMDSSNSIYSTLLTGELNQASSQSIQDRHYRGGRLTPAYVYNHSMHDQGHWKGDTGSKSWRLLYPVSQYLHPASQFTRVSNNDLRVSERKWMGAGVVSGTGGEGLGEQESEMMLRVS